MWKRFDGINSLPDIFLLTHFVLNNALDIIYKEYFIILNGTNRNA